MTAVEWLIEQVADRGLDCGSGIRMKIQVPKDIAEQANAMFEQQIIDAYKFGISDEYVIGSEKYYNQTYNQ